jgi:hypothetical protein
MSDLTIETIKVGRETYEVKKGDYILYNGACYQFIAGDMRTLKHQGWTSYSSLMIPKTLVKKIPFDSMLKKEVGESLTKWYF